MNHPTEKESGEFYTRFCPFAKLIYRNALIMTGCPRSAEKLQVDVYLKAFIAYLQAGHVANFEEWLAEIVAEIFSKNRRQSRAPDLSAEAFGGAEQLILKKLAGCK